jgi:two-component system alkaline phosphatase synthesis response regulator PhoP
MIVDDEPDQRYTIKITLEDANEDFEVISASSGMECIKKLKENPVPDLILLDIMMPEMNGWEVLKIIRENNKWKNIPVVFLTAKTDELVDKHTNILANDYIEKPFEINELNKRIKKLLN